MYDKHHNLGLQYVVLIIFKYHLEIAEQNLHFHFFSLNVNYLWVSKLPGPVVQTLPNMNIILSQNNPVHLWRIHQVQAACINTLLVSLNCLTPRLTPRKRKTVTQCYCGIKYYLYIATKVNLEVILGISGRYSTVTHLLLLNARAHMCIGVLEMFQ